MLSPSQIERRARRLLRDVGIESAPVDVYRIAKTLGAVVREEASTTDISGALFREDNRVVIGVNASHAKIRKRFTVAHELGHLLLHDELVRIDHHYAVVTGDKLQLKATALRSQVSSEATDPREIEANRFAAALLMPITFLDEALHQRSFPLGAEMISRLASLFDVSTQAMTYRLLNTGVPLDLGDAHE